MTMKGVPSSSVAASSTRATCSLWIRAAARASRRKRAIESGPLTTPGKRELDRDALLELQVIRGDDDSHASRSEHALDAVFADDDVAFAYSNDRVRTALHHALALPIYKAAAWSAEAQPTRGPFHAPRGGAVKGVTAPRPR